MDIRHVDIKLAAIVEVPDRDVHSFVGVLADAAEHPALHMNESASLVIEV